MLEVGDSEAVVYGLDPACTYHIEHTGLDAAGDADTSLVVYTVSAAAEASLGGDADMAEGDQRAPLLAGKLRRVGPGLRSLAMLAENGGAPIVAVHYVTRR